MRPPSSSDRIRSRGVAIPALLVTGALLFTACGDDGTDTVSEPADDIVIEDIELEDIELEDLPGAVGSGLDKPEVQLPEELPTELVITDLVEGSGTSATDGDTVYVNYVGVRSADGQEFDNNYDSPVPFAVTLGQRSVIQGWETGLVGATTGMRRQLDIPADLAYGDSGAGGVIEPGDALSFVVDVRAVVPAVSAADAPDGLDLATVEGLEAIDIIDARLADGPPIGEGETAVVHIQLYRGSDLELLLDTWEFGSPELIPLIEGATLSGLVNGLVGMNVDGLRIVSIPSEQAWGELGNDRLGIGPNEDVVLVAELVAKF